MKSYDLKELSTANKKVDKVKDMGLSSNDFNANYKNLLDEFLRNGTLPTIILTSSDNTAYTSSWAAITKYYNGLLVVGYNNKNAVNNANATLNINSLGAKPIYYKNRAIKAGEFPYRSVSLFLYTNWTAFNGGGGAWVLLDTPDTTYSADNSSLQLDGTTFGIKNSGVSEEKIKDYNVSRIKIADNAINLDKIDSSVFGTGSGTIAEGNHTHNVGSTSGKVVVTGSGGSLTTNNVVVLTATFSDGNSANYKVLGS